MGRKVPFRWPARLRSGPLRGFSVSFRRYVLGSPYAGSRMLILYFDFNLCQISPYPLRSPGTLLLRWIVIHRPAWLKVTISVATQSRTLLTFVLVSRPNGLGLRSRPARSGFAGSCP
jgi:hypothetical protein